MMIDSSQPASYNQRIPHMDGRWSGSLRTGWLASLVLVALPLAFAFFPVSASASELGDTARLLAHKIASATGPGTIALEVANRSSLDEKSVREVRGALEAELRVAGVRTARPEESMGTVQVTLSESIRKYVWIAEIQIGTDERKVVLVTASVTPANPALSLAMPLVVRKTLLITQEWPILDVAILETSGGARLLVLDAGEVRVLKQMGGRWEEEDSLEIKHARVFPRDVRGRLLLRRDHFFDVYLPGILCRAGGTMPLTLACFDNDALWPLTTDEGGVRASFAQARNFFTGAFSPGIGKVANGPSFYSAAALPRAGYTLWVLAGVDGSVHLLDGMTDQLVRGARWGSDLAAVHSGCGTGTQLLVSENGEPSQDTLRAFEIPDRDPVAASAPLEFNGAIVALWTETSGAGAIAIVKRDDTGSYEAYRISIACGS